MQGLLSLWLSNFCNSMCLLDQAVGSSGYSKKCLSVRLPSAFQCYCIGKREKMKDMQDARWNENKVLNCEYACCAVDSWTTYSWVESRYRRRVGGAIENMYWLWMTKVASDFIAVRMCFVRLFCGWIFGFVCGIGSVP